MLLERDYIKIFVNDNDIYSRLKGIPASVTSSTILELRLSLWFALY